VHLEDSRVEVSEEERPQVLEVLCDECETALNFDEMDETIQKELRLTLGARERPLNPPPPRSSRTQDKPIPAAVRSVFLMCQARES
jgi:hypothetical protein